MRCNNTHALLQSRLRPTHDKGERKHCPREQLDWDLNNDKRRLLATVVLGESVNEGEEEGLSEDMTSQ